MIPTSLKSRAGYFGLGPVLVAFLFAFTLSVVCWSKLEGHQIFTDPVAGANVWNDVDKSRDMHALMLLVGCAVALTVGISVLCHETAPLGPGSDLGAAVNQFLLFSLVPAGWRLALACMSPSDRLPPIRFVSAFPLGAVLVILFLRKYREHLLPDDIFTIGGAILLAPVMAAFSALALLMSIVRLIPKTVQTVSPYVSGLTAAAVIAVIAILIGSFVLSKPLDLFRRRVLRCLMASQVLLPLLVFHLIPPPMVDLTRQFSNPYPTGLVITLGLIAVAGMYLMYRRFKSADSGSAPSWQLSLVPAISPVAIAAISIFVFCDTLGLPVISIDYFHNGERLVPWQQIWDYHRIPYVDFAPIHGLMEVGRGAVNQLFFSGAMPTYAEADVLLAGLAVAATAFTAAELVTPLGALFLLLAVMPDMDRMFFVASPLFLIASPRLLRKPVLWIAVWLVLGLLLCGYNAAMGPAFVLGTLPAALWQTFRSIRISKWRFSGLLAVCLLCAAAVLVVPLLKQMTFGFVKFILDNQWTNESANGIAWSQAGWTRDRPYGIGSSQIFWELIRFGWIPVVIASAAVHWKLWSKPIAERNVPALVLSGSIPPVLLWSCLWVIERLDPGTIGRSGSLTVVAVFLMMPVLLFLILPRKQAGLFVLLLAACMGFISPTGQPALEPRLLAQKASVTRLIAAGTAMVDGTALGLPRLGQVIKPNPDFTVGILNLRKDLSQWLKPGETYFDLSDETALYYYLDMLCPTQYAAYVAGNSRLQAVMMKQLEAHPVPVVLISPSGWLDDAPLSLRCYRPYHDYVLKYSAVAKDGFMYLIDPSRVPEAGAVGSEPQLELLDLIFKRKNLLRLPIAWGNSWPSMANRFAMVAKVPGAQTASLNAGHPFAFTWTIPPAANSGRKADYLRFHINFDLIHPEAYKQAVSGDPVLTATSAEPHLILTWTRSDGTSSDPIEFKAHSGDLLVPLGAYPRWLLGSDFRSLTLTLQNPGSARQMTVSGVEFLRLKPLD